MTNYDQNRLFARIGQRMGALAMAALFATMAFAPALAQDSSGVYLSGAERIDVSDRVRFLSQRISAAACLVDAGLDVETHRDVIAQAVGDFDNYMDALRDGDAALGITVVEEDRKMLTAIRGVQLQWDGFRRAAQARLGGGEVPSGPDYVSRQNLNLMHASKYLISEVISTYSIPPALLQSDAFTLDIVARQRSLSHQIAKEACGVITGNTVMGNMVRFDKSVRRYDASFNALLNGFEAAGVSPPPTPEIRAGLQAMADDWVALRADLAQVSGAADPALAVSIFNQFDSMSDQFDALIPLYVTQSKSGI